MNDSPRLIEHAFPLKQASLDSVHEKNVRHGHISTLHIWPARRPLAACRAALIATLLLDPGTPEKRQELCEKIGGKVVKKIERKKMPNGRIVERIKEETEGGILHWGRERENADTLEWFQQEIRKAYGGRAPKVLDPFAGGGAIPLEAMRLGCEATAVDINPVAWFILKCTLEYPQKLSGQTRPLPEFILQDEEFMRDFFKKAKGYSKAETGAALKRLRNVLKQNKKGTTDGPASLPFPDEEDELEADLAWQVRAWGQWILDRARRDLAKYYPIYADFEPIKPGEKPYEPQPMRLVPLNDDGTSDIDALNSDFSHEYLADKRNPRWVAKPTVAYLWARTVTCKNCRATIPLLKTRWLCKKPNKRVLLTMEPKPDGSGVEFGVEADVQVKGGNVAQRREHDKLIGAGTMSRAGAKCPCCGAIMTMEDIRIEGKSAGLGAIPTSVVVDGQKGKEYRLPTEFERRRALDLDSEIERVYSDVPFGLPTELMPREDALGMRIPKYGFKRWCDLFTPRQLVALGIFVKHTRDVRTNMTSNGYSLEWCEAVGAYLSSAVCRQADYSSTICIWALSEFICHTFARFALPITWDFVETNVIGGTSGNFLGALDWVSRYIDHGLRAAEASPPVNILNASAISGQSGWFDLVLTDPPYYDAIPYSDLMDFFYVWWRRLQHGISTAIEEALTASLSPKWNHEQRDGELIDDQSRHGGNASYSKQVYEDGMERSFRRCFECLTENGRLMVVFAHKHPDAWETLVAAIIRSGFVVDGSWPIQTERQTRMRATSSAALASSVWLVCRKRAATSRVGWDSKVLGEMREKIAEKLREFWDAGIRGPDFVWAATGPALEAYSKHPVVKKANEPNAIMEVNEFLRHVRRMVVDYVVGQVLTGEQGADMAAADRLDEVTAYYLLHRHDFGMAEAPVGACILYATACSLSDSELVNTWGLLSRTGPGGSSSIPDDEDDESDDESADSTGAAATGSKVRLKPWTQRTGKNMGYEAPGGRGVPLIDRVHRLMHLWKAGDVHKVDEYLDEYALRRNELFKRVVQSLIELSQDNERSILESISNHIGIRGAVREKDPMLPYEKGS